MYEADAIAQGLIKPPASKVRTPPANKMRKPPPENKIGQRIVATGSHEPQTVMAEIVKLEDEVALNAEAPPPEEQPGPESIPGIGKASARALAAHGVITLDALKEAQDLDYLPAKVLAAIAKWRVKRG
jgi:predicted flap endonuclease-1-like 5' DNA nuclease